MGKKDHFDNVKWHFDDAYSNYCKRFNCKDDNQNEQVTLSVTRYASTHIGMYLAWIIKHEFASDLHQDNDKEDLAKVKNEEMTGTEFFLKNCGSTFSSYSLNEPGLEFTRAYYQEDYLKDFLDIAHNRFDLKYCPYEIEDNWENYQLFETVISDAYEQFIIKKRFTDLNLIQKPISNNEVEKVEKTIDLNLHAYLSWKIKAWANYEQNLLEEANKCINIAIQINPKISDLYKLKGDILRGLGRYQEALEYYSTVIAYEPNKLLSKEWVEDQGDLLQELGRYDEALSFYDNTIKKLLEEIEKCNDSAIKIKSTIAYLYKLKGRTLKGLERYQEALDCFDTTIAYEPDNYSNWVCKGYFFEEINRFEEALKCYDKSIELYPENINVWESKGGLTPELWKL